MVGLPKRRPRGELNIPAKSAAKSLAHGNICGSTRLKITLTEQVDGKVRSNKILTLKLSKSGLRLCGPVV